MKIYLGSDHRGFRLKEKLKKWLQSQGYEVFDKGAFRYDKDDDYPDFIIPVAKSVANDSPNSRGIIMGASGQGEAMAANRFKNVRASIYYGGPSRIIRLSREHNNADILSLGAAFLNFDSAKKAIDLWLKTPFSAAQRHIRRLKKIDGKK